jgi:preprotein translocase subunit SecF
MPEENTEKQSEDQAEPSEQQISETTIEAKPVAKVEKQEQKTVKPIREEKKEEKPKQEHKNHTAHHAEQKSNSQERKHKSWLLHVYDTKYKELMIFTMLILLVAIGYIGFHYYQTGDFLYRGVSLKGGTTLTLPDVPNVDVASLQAGLSSKFPDLEISTRTLTEAGVQKGIILDTAAKEKKDLDDIISALREKGIKTDNISVETVGSSLGKDFFKQAMLSLLFSFLLMAIVVFITFRDIIPSFFVVLAAFSTIVCSWAVVLAMGTNLSTAGVAAFIMLILYSVDTDILLTTRVLKNKEGSLLERTLDAMATGMTMSLSALAVTLVGFFLSQSDVIKQIMMILSIGLVFDILNTWIQNAGILRWHMENKAKKHE